MAAKLATPKRIYEKKKAKQEKILASAGATADSVVDTDLDFSVLNALRTIKKLVAT